MYELLQELNGITSDIEQVMARVNSYSRSVDDISDDLLEELNFIDEMLDNALQSIDEASYTMDNIEWE